MYFKAAHETPCSPNMIITEYWECEIATYKFRTNRNPFDRGFESDWFPAGCYCENLDETECGDRGFNSNFSPRDRFVSLRALCRMQGILL